MEQQLQQERIVIENDDEIDYPYVLTINRSVDGVFTQSIVDAAGNSFASWITHNDDVMITRNEYDKKTTQLSLSKIENQNGFESKYEYDDVGRLVASKTPDCGRTETKYDSKNRIRFTRDAKQISKGDGHFNIFTYDDEDRLVLTGEVRGNCNNCSFSNPNADLSAYTYPTVETIYGMPKVSDILKSDVPEVVKKNNKYYISVCYWSDWGGLKRELLEITIIENKVSDIFEVDTEVLMPYNCGILF